MKLYGEEQLSIQFLTTYKKELIIYSSRLLYDKTDKTDYKCKTRQDGLIDPSCHAILIICD